MLKGDVVISLSISTTSLLSDFRDGITGSFGYETEITVCSFMKRRNDVRRGLHLLNVQCSLLLLGSSSELDVQWY